MTRRIDPEVAAAEMRAAGVVPLETYPGAREPWLCHCRTCGNKVSPRLGDIRQGQGACRYCAGQGPVDPETARREFADAGVEMIGEFVNTQEPTLCRCLTCGNKGMPRLTSVRKGQGACQYCGGNAPVDPEVAAAEMRAAGVEPLESYTHALHPWLCRCDTCGSEVTPTLANVRTGQGACRFCASHGFQSDEPGVLYLIRHDDFNALKIGITNQTTERLSLHESDGWALVDLWLYDIGDDARTIEQTVLASWKMYDQAVADEDMPIGGHTETVSLDDVSEAEAVALIEETIASLIDRARRP